MTGVDITRENVIPSAETTYPSTSVSTGVPRRRFYRSVIAEEEKSGSFDE